MQSVHVAMAFAAWSNARYRPSSTLGYISALETMNPHYSNDRFRDGPTQVTVVPDLVGRLNAFSNVMRLAQGRVLKVSHISTLDEPASKDSTNATGNCRLTWDEPTVFQADGKNVSDQAHFGGCNAFVDTESMRTGISGRCAGARILYQAQERDVQKWSRR